MFNYFNEFKSLYIYKQLIKLKIKYEELVEKF